MSKPAFAPSLGEHFGAQNLTGGHAGIARQISRDKYMYVSSTEDTDSWYSLQCRDPPFARGRDTTHTPLLIYVLNTPSSFRQNVYKKTQPVHDLRSPLPFSTVVKNLKHQVCADLSAWHTGE